MIVIMDNVKANRKVINYHCYKFPTRPKVYFFPQKTLIRKKNRSSIPNESCPIIKTASNIQSFDLSLFLLLIYPTSTGSEMLNPDVWPNYT